MNICSNSTELYLIHIGITDNPETFIVDEKGTIVLRHVGPIDFSDRIGKP